MTRKEVLHLLQNLPFAPLDAVEFVQETESGPSGAAALLGDMLQDPETAFDAFWQTWDEKKVLATYYLYGACACMTASRKHLEGDNVGKEQKVWSLLHAMMRQTEGRNQV